MRSFTKYDAFFLAEILIAVIVNEHVLHLSLSLVLLLILIGLFFEVVTEKFWTYSEEFRQSIFVIADTDISVSAAVSWAGMLMVCINLSSLAAAILPVPHAVWWASILVVGIIGNTMETVCVRWGAFVYEESWITKMIFFKKSVYLWDVPIMIRLGYFLNFGPLCALLLLWAKYI